MVDRAVGVFVTVSFDGWWSSQSVYRCVIGWLVERQECLSLCHLMVGRAVGV